jgi:hypothetical protein
MFYLVFQSADQFFILKEEEEDDEGVQGHQKAITESKVKDQEDEVVEGQLEKEQQKTDQPIETRDKTFLTEVSGVTNKSRNGGKKNSFVI